MSNLNPEILQRFLNDPEEMLNSRFEFWGITSFVNTSAIIEHLINTNPSSPLIPRLTKKSVEFMKYCYDNDKEFPWDETFPQVQGKTGKEQFMECYSRLQWK